MDEFQGEDTQLIEPRKLFNDAEAVAERDAANAAAQAAREAAAAAGITPEMTPEEALELARAERWRNRGQLVSDAQMAAYRVAPMFVVTAKQLDEFVWDPANKLVSPVRVVGQVRKPKPRKPVYTGPKTDIGKFRMIR